MIQRLAWGLVLLGLASCASPPTPDPLSSPLPRGELGAHGLAPEPWPEALAEIRERSLRVDSLIVTKAGEVVAEYGRSPHTPTTLHDMRSSTKSVTALLVGGAIDRGLLTGVDASVADFFPEMTVPASWSSRRLTIEDLLTMRSGLDCNDWDSKSPGNEEKMYDTSDWLRFFFSIEAVEPAGERFSYCTAGVVVLGEIVARASGRALPEVAQEWLFSPLGIELARFAQAPKSVTDAGGHLEISAESLTKILLLAMAKGRSGDVQVISEPYVEAMLRPHTSLVPRDRPGPRYGYLFWLEPVVDGVVRSFQTRGNGGQYAIALPELDATITFTGHAYNDTEEQSKFFEIAQRRLIPWLRGDS